jgi:hypothetical protein
LETPDTLHDRIRQALISAGVTGEPLRDLASLRAVTELGRRCRDGIPRRLRRKGVVKLKRGAYGPDDHRGRR